MRFLYGSIPFMETSATRKKLAQFSNSFLLAAFHVRQAQLKFCSFQDSVPFTTSCLGSLQADWRSAVYVFKHDMHRKSVLPDVVSNFALKFSEWTKTIDK